MLIVREPVRNEVGLHARPAALFVQSANKFRSRITIRNVKRGAAVNAKSILHVLTLGVGQGDEVEIAVEGEDEAAAAETLRHLLVSDFADAAMGEKK
ncbi:MAG: HPr family phosphocarrier protein [Acidobacteriota bacterium]